MDGNRITKSDLLMITSRVYDLNELCSTLGVPYSITMRCQDVNYNGEHFPFLEIMLWNESESSYEEFVSKDFYEKLVDWEIKFRSLVDSSNYDKVNGCIDRCIEDIDFSAGILLSKESFSSIFRECMQKFNEVKHE